LLDDVRVVPAKAVPAQTGQRGGLVKGQHPVGVIDDGSLAGGQPGATATIVLGTWSGGTSSGTSIAAGTVSSPTTLPRGSLGSLGSGTGGHHKTYSHNDAAARRSMTDQQSIAKRKIAGVTGAQGRSARDAAQGRIMKNQEESGRIRNGFS
jgi:hypothetical protein